MSKGIVIGPTFAGKTVLLATLQHATRTMRSGPSDPIYRVFPESPAMTELFHLCSETIQRGRMPVVATNAVTEYSFELSATRKRLWGFGEKEERHPFRMWDGPGGSVFREHAEAAQDIDFAATSRGDDGSRRKMISEITSAEGLVLCVDSTAPEKAGVFFRQLPHLLNEGGVRTLAATKVVICLTKIDAHVAGAGNVLRRCRQLDPVALGRRVLTRTGLRALREYLAPGAAVAFGVTSAYGFIESEGSANYDPVNDRMETCFESGYSPQQIDEAWAPFRVLDPFIYLATGAPGGLKIVKAREL